MSTKFQTNKTTSLRATRLFSNLKSNPMYAMEGIHCSSFPGPVFCQLSLLTGKLREVLHFQDLCYLLHSEETMPQPTRIPYKIVKAGRRAVILRKAHLHSSLQITYSPHSPMVQNTGSSNCHLLRIQSQILFSHCCCFLTLSVVFLCPTSYSHCFLHYHSMPKASLLLIHAVIFNFLPLFALHTQEKVTTRV